MNQKHDQKKEESREQEVNGKFIKEAIDAGARSGNTTASASAGFCFFAESLAVFCSERQESSGGDGWSRQVCWLHLF